MDQQSHGRYILDEHGEPTPEPDLKKWNSWCQSRPERTDWIVGKTPVGGIVVSTVFLALDDIHGEGPPMLYETMCRGCKDDDELCDIQEQYATRDEAVAGHAQIVALVEAKKRPS